MAEETEDKLRTLIVDDEPLAVERMQVICSKMDALNVVGTASDGAQALRLVEALTPDLILLDMTMPEVDGLSVAKTLAKQEQRPAVVFVTAHDNYAVEAFDLDAVDYVLKPVKPDRLERAIQRALARRGDGDREESKWLEELWIPHRSELIRIDTEEVSRIDAERDYVRLHVEDRSYLLLQTIAGLEKRLDPAKFIRIHRSTILRKDRIKGLRHDGLGVWSVEMEDGEALRIGRTYLPKVKAMAGR
ncbi:LytTR family DNA-binding domain-containing protein [Qipengyuania sp. 1NDW9]|uniref:LytTR family DNA-binding domain-containing protein n=2 Tax=Qipengyuania TaxID=1855416 RepID=A0A9Q3S362_9SPHN|nr:MULTISPECIES: LytTR family DNA-binding domain-containing protein [Qipengyuania]MBX7491712.1 LytTR family DNA-binding domain-containing protein [Qipengyuania xiapuensis]MBY6127367.1 LytTR family DNA-binding domain-containing protein [Qipengyuania aquimaris]MBY6219108.1 LytTR family DNA-binding domain-containing protein [Qipengyuania aquimaris]QZD91571.1 LytTR family DNA-binding domain-containing protein [Qipengyuania xiapuensis]UOR16137.1 LytTR family DNA-binding domain-containing protein [Q